MITDKPEVEVDEAPPHSIPAAPHEPSAPGQSAASSAPPAPDAPDSPVRRRKWPWLLALVVVALGIYLLVHRSGSANPAAKGAKGKGGAAGAAGDAASRPIPVTATAAATKDVGVYLTGLGTVVPLNTVAVKSRVDGQLVRIAFHEGQLVRAGDLLAQLDPRPFQVQLMQAEGQRAKDEAALQNARVDLARYQVLIKEDSIPRQQLDTQAATVAQIEASLKSDQAQIESAKLNLAYARITAPTGGRVGLRQVDLGNIVHAGDPNGVVVITQLQPIDVVFTLPADHLPEVLPQLHTGKSLAVDAYDRDLKHKLATGELLAVDNQIDPTTGTVRMKALFGNGDEALFPNQFVNALLLVNTLKGAVTVPTAALQRSPQATFVYVVKPDRTVETRNVVVEQTEGDDAALRSGVAAGELVVVEGVDKLRPGAKVDLGNGGNGKGGRGGGGAGAGGAGSTSGGHSRKAGR